MMARRHGVNDPGGRRSIVGNEIIRIWVEYKGFILLDGRRAAALFFVLDGRGRPSI